MIVISARALADIDRLYNFLQPENPGAAERAMQAIRRKLELIEHMPGLGLQTKSPFIRQTRVSFGKRGYVVRYMIRKSDAALVVLRIWHGREARR